MHNYYFSLRFLLWVFLLICTPVTAALANTADEISLSPLSCNLPAPGGLSVTGVTTNSISIAWNPVSGAIGYAVKFEEVATGTVVLNTTVTSTNATATSLNAGTLYRYSVAAICANGNRSENDSDGEVRTKFIVVDDIVVNFPNIIGTVVNEHIFSAASPISLAIASGPDNEVVFNLVKEYDPNSQMDLQVLHDNDNEDSWVFANEEPAAPNGNGTYLGATAVRVYHGSGSVNSIIGTENNHVMTFSVELIGSALDQIKITIIEIDAPYVVNIKGSTKVFGRGPASGAQAGFQSNTLSASPNPFKDELNIQLEQDAEAGSHLQLMDAQGRVLRTQTLEAGFRTTSIPTTDLAPGLYFVRMETSKGVSTCKVVRSN